MSKGFFRLAAVALLLVVAPAMAGDFQAPADGANNPPPKEAFSAFLFHFLVFLVGCFKIICFKC